MRVRVLKPNGIAYAPDGIHVQTHAAGEVTDLPEPFFSLFVERRWVEEDKALTGPSETKTGKKKRGRATR